MSRSYQIVNTSSSSLPVNPLSSFSATTTKPSLGAAFTYHADISLFVQETGRVFGMVDQTERERTRTEPGLRALVEVLKSRVSVSHVRSGFSGDTVDEQPAGRWAVFETVSRMGGTNRRVDDLTSRKMGWVCSMWCPPRRRTNGH